MLQRNSMTASLHSVTYPVVSGLRLARQVGVGVDRVEAGLRNFHRECRGTFRMDAGGPSVGTHRGVEPPVFSVFWSGLFV